jgi:hypothetical protein
MRVLTFALVAVLLEGCEPAQPPPSTKTTGAIVKATATDIPIYNEKTSGKPLDPAAFGDAIKDLAMQFDVTEQIEAYKNEHGHYPRDYAEFKSGVVIPNDITFPEKLPMGVQVQYDEANHRIVFVRPRSGR